MNAVHPLRLLVIDDEQPALDELEFLLGRDHRVGSVRTCDSATEALRLLRETEVDGVFLDIRMPGLAGLELAGVLANFRSPPPVVFVTAHDEHAVDAFELDALDYVLKPVREERLADAVRRVSEHHTGRTPRDDEQVAVELGGVTRFVSRARHRMGRGAGRLRPAARRRPEPPAPRAPLTTLEEGWAEAGSCASTARCWSTSRTSTRCGWTPDAAPSWSATRSSRQPAPHARAARPAGAACEAGRAAMTEPVPDRVRVTSPRRSAPGRARTGASEIDAQTQLGELYMSSLLREPGTTGGHVLVALSSWSAGCRCSSPGRHHSRTSSSSGCRCRGCCSGSPSTR